MFMGVTSTSETVIYVDIQQPNSYALIWCLAAILGLVF